MSVEEEIESIGIRDFRANLHKYTKDNQHPIAVTSHGECIGFYIPARQSHHERDLESLRQATAKLSTMLKSSGVSVDEIIKDFQEARKADTTSK